MSKDNATNLATHPATIKMLKDKIAEQQEYIDKADLAIIRERIENRDLKRQLNKIYSMIRTILEDARKSKLKEVIKLVEDEKK